MMRLDNRRCPKSWHQNVAAEREQLLLGGDQVFSEEVLCRDEQGYFWQSDKTGKVDFLDSALPAGQGKAREK